MNDEVAPHVWHHEEIIGHGIRALAEGGVDGAPLIDGRVLSVRATPVNGTSTSMAIGLSVLPPGGATPPHSHDAEELATVLRGEGTITIDGADFPVRPGSVVLTPSRSTHVTSAGPHEPLVVWWTYAPAGSEQRWLDAGAVDPR
ncbi:cupin domain-containing protein [Planosporangium thailandense]|uniref:Cupin domain-containing protein n=1 Tax=Planosporangium thailandense TaxID=765197 RepID=A0ABX0Y3F9_9ACTN|nr:cupin domain-containing protein [Planosporangium thailandense]